MAVEEQWLRVRRSLEEKLGVEEASYLMDRPPGGWSELVTNHTLDLKFDVIEQRFIGVDQRFIGVDQRFVSINERFDALEAHMDAGFNAAREHVEVSISVLRHELRADVAAMEAALAWRVITAVIGGMAVMGALFAGITSIAGG